MLLILRKIMTELRLSSPPWGIGGDSTLERKEITRDSPQEERDQLFAERKRRRVARKEKVILLRLNLKIIHHNLQQSGNVPDEIKKELLSKLNDIDIGYEDELAELLEW